MTALSVLAIDDEAPSLDELAFLLDRNPLVERVETASSATEGLRQLQDGSYHAVFLDIRMPGLDGIELARILGRFAVPPSLVFVTAHESHALDAFEVGALGYLLKPIDVGRLDRVLQRVADQSGRAPALEGSPPDVIAVETAGRTVLVARSDIVWVESAGDYVRLHLRDGASHLLRAPMSALEGWPGFVRVHRGYLVSLRDVSELRTEEGHSAVQVGETLLPVSRRHLHELRERLVRQGRPAAR